jgi:hypothetical protein
LGYILLPKLEPLMSEKLASLLAQATPKGSIRKPGAWGPSACTAWRETDEEGKALLSAALIFEGKKDRLATIEDEEQILKTMAASRAAIAVGLTKDEA